MGSHTPLLLPVTVSRVSRFVVVTSRTPTVSCPVLSVVLCYAGAQAH